MSEPRQKKPTITATRIVIWVAVGGIGLYLLITGLVGVITKGS